MRVRDIQIGLTLAALLTLVSAAGAQDLGSFNKLFGGTTKRVSSTKKAVARKKPPYSRPKLSISKADDTAPSNTIIRRPASFLSAARIKRNLSAAELKQYEGLLDEGSRARLSRNYTSAESAYRRANKVKPGDARALAGLGGVYADRQLWREAGEVYEAAAALDPKNATILTSLSYVLSQPIFADDLSLRYERAEKAARSAVQLAPTNAVAYDQLGNALKVLGHIGPETEAAYRRSIELDLSFAPAYAHLGRLLALKGRTNDSNAAFEKAIGYAVDVPSKVIVAEVLQSESRFNDAEKLLRTAVSFDPKNQSAMVMLGHALVALGKYREAEQVLLHSLTLGPNAFGPTMLLGSPAL